MNSLTGTASKRAQTGFKAAAKVPGQALLALDSGLQGTFGIRMDRFQKGFDTDPLAMKGAELDAIDLATVPFLVFFADREGNQTHAFAPIRFFKLFCQACVCVTSLTHEYSTRCSLDRRRTDCGLRTKNINTLLWTTKLPGALRGDPLHMDANCCTKAANAAGFGSVLPTLMVPMNVGRGGAFADESFGNARANPLKLYQDVFLCASDEFLEHSDHFGRDWNLPSRPSDEILHERFLQTGHHAIRPQDKAGQTACT